MRDRTENAPLALVGLLVVFGTHGTPAVAQDRPLEGQVVDARGGGVAGATIFLTPIGRVRYSTSAQVRSGPAPAADDGSGRVVRSAADGSFATLLPLGRYRIAAFKPGYAVALGEVNLQARGLVEMKMSPLDKTSTGATEDAAGDDRGLDWILRQPGVDVLRDREQSARGPIEAEGPAPGSSPPGAPVTLAATQRLPFSGEVQRSVGGTGLKGGEDRGSGGLSSRATRIGLNGRVGEQVSWWFDGMADRAEAAIEGDDGVIQARRSSGLDLAFDIRPRAGDVVQTRLRYGARRYILDPYASHVAVDQDQRSSGVRTQWTRSLSQGTLLYMTGGYLETGVRGETSAVDPGYALEENATEGGMDRSVGAGAALSFRADDHDVGVGVRVHSYRYGLGDDGAGLALVDPAAASLESAGQGNAMSLFSRDDWSLAEGYVLSYGLGYHNNLSVGGAYLVPRVGLTRTLPGTAGLVMRSALVYRVDDRPTPDGTGARQGDARVEAARMGYEFGVERRPADRLQFAATVSYVPCQAVNEDEGPLASPGASDHPVLVLADAAAGRRQMEVELYRSFGFVRGSFVGSIGRVEGRLRPVLDEAPLQRLKEGEARYYLTSLRALFEPTDTELRVDFRKVMEDIDPAAGGGFGSLAYRRLDLAVLQDLPWVAVANSRWRVLMAYQGLLYGSLDDPAAPATGFTSRLTGGVDVSF